MTTKRSLLLAMASGGMAAVLLAGTAWAQDPEIGATDVPIVMETTTDEVPPTTEEDQPVSGDEQLSAGELIQLLNLPSAAVLQEKDIDPGRPANIFDTAEKIRVIFGDKPKFIYLPEGQDPMIIPWVRQRIIAEELFKDATIATANRDFDLALTLLRRIREQAPNTKEAEMAPAEMARVEAMRTSGGTPVDTRPEAPVDVASTDLPEWVKKNTTGIILGANPVVIVGNDFLKTTDSVPRYPSVRVKSISTAEVVYTFQNKDFTVEVIGSF